MKKQAFNPYLPSCEYIPDGEPYVFGDRLYVYGSHDKFNGEAFCMNDYVCWSAPVDDLSDWRCEGVIYRRSQDPRNADGTHYMYAPDIVRGPDGRYYLYYTLDMIGIMAVAAGDSPTGPFEYYGEVRHASGAAVGEAKGDIYQFDPGVLLDDDGRVFLYTGFGAPVSESSEEKFMHGRRYEGAYCLELESDMLTVKGEPVCIIPQVSYSAGTEFEGHAFFEASSIRKTGGTYYFIYSSINSHELCYAVSRYPDRGYSYGGTVVSNGDVGLNGWTTKHSSNYIGNNHGGMVRVKDQWYIFYHRHTNQHAFSRQGCAEPIEFDKNGRILQAEITSCGLNGKPLRGTGRYEASIACSLFSKDGAGFIYEIGDLSVHPYFTQTGEDREEQGDQYIANMQDGAVAGFKYFDLTETRRIRIEISGNGKGYMKVMSGPEGSVCCRIPVDTGNPAAVMESELNLHDDRAQLYFRFTGEGSINFHSFELES